MVTVGKPLSELKSAMSVLPQVLINVDVARKPPLESATDIQHMINEIEEKLKGKGRVLVRYSGTQPQCRVMVEGPTEKETNAYCQQIAEQVQKTLN